MNIYRRRPDAPRKLLSLMAGAALIACFALPAPLAAQNQAPSTRWRTILLPQVDLWYHGLATAQFEGFGPDELYDAGYALRLRDAKQKAGVLPTRLDDQAAYFGSAFRRDSTFEVFHFVPLYFAATTVDPMLDALATVAGAEGTPSVDDALAQFGASAVAGTIPREDQRAILADWTEALRVEWSSFYADYWRERAIQSGPRLQAIQSDWDDNFAPRLAAYLHAYALDNGVLVLSDPVGPEGRIFEGDPANRSDNIVVVGFDESAGPRAPLYAAVREMCFPVVREVLADSPSAPDRASAATRSSNAAVRCGAYLLDRFAPDLAAGYRSGLVPDASGSPADIMAVFERKYPIDAALSVAIQEKLGDIPGP